MREFSGFQGNYGCAVHLASFASLRRTISAFHSQTANSHKISTIYFECLFGA
ncbi:MAG: hypothetical protein MR902_07800 [Campylobacter sp.]|nr:hypothetical protein [Campylobacter sp.]